MALRSTHPLTVTPVVTASSLRAAHGASFAATSLFKVSDADGDTIAKYAFWNSGTGGGHFVLGGIAQGPGQEIDVTAARLSQLSYQSGSGADTLWVRANDGLHVGQLVQRLHRERAHRRSPGGEGIKPQRDPRPAVCGRVARDGQRPRRRRHPKSGILEQRHRRRPFRAQRRGAAHRARSSTTRSGRRSFSWATSPALGRIPCG